MGSSFPYRWVQERLAALSGRGVFIGTSSWKYPGWLDGVYDEQRYLTRGKFSTARFERDCLRWSPISGQSGAELSYGGGQ